MHSLGLLAFGGVGIDQLKPFIPLGFALGGVYAVSGVGMVVLYRATGVLNLAFGAIGAAGALISWYLLHHTGCPEVLAYLVCVGFGGALALVYGVILIWNLFWTLFKDGSLKKVGVVYWRNFVEHRRRYQRGVFGFAQFANRCVTHWHFYKFTREGISGRLRLFNSG